MNTSMLTNVLMSVLFFSPMLIALGAFLFMGVLILFEGAAAFFGKHAQEPVAIPAQAAATGPVAAGLIAAIAAEGEQKAAPGEAATATVAKR